MDDVLFNQWGILAGATGIDSTTNYKGDATDFAANMEQQIGIALDFLLRKKRSVSAGIACEAPVSAIWGANSIVNPAAVFVR
jgi:hypothetical protein